MTTTLDHRGLPGTSIGLDGAPSEPVVRVVPLLATLASAAALSPAVIWLFTRSREVTGASSDLLFGDVDPDPTSGAVLLVLALVLCLVPFMVGRAAARRSSTPMKAALVTVAAVLAGVLVQLLFA
ncbi:hypothetical protein ACSDQ9_09345 [Aestuariimicrobium soli]|uniref:hypothetical protein n=1 Tax=Aestuariimicrobium soli TaxID=2035834 RepID=UPI003EB7C84B